MRLVVVSTAPPRRCGLAAFTDDLRSALAAETGWRVRVCAIDRDGLSYGEEVLTTIRQYDAEDYRRAARTIAAAGTDLVVIQHEFGIFGGPDGSHILELADELRLRGVPYAVTLHTIVSRPGPNQRATLAALCSGAARVTVFGREGRRLANETAVAPAHRVTVVAHGAPAVLRTKVDRHLLGPHVVEVLRGLGDARVMTTFGLVGPGKGLENGIEALAKVATTHPDTHYLIAGATHPEVIRRHGESYRQGLERLADELGVSSQVRFLDAFLTEEELSAVLRRTDLFLTPYRSREQICSGALTFALAAGLPVVSTAYRYAEEMLSPVADGVAPGVVVPCDDVDALAQAVCDLFADSRALRAARAAADRLGAALTWPAVARRFAGVFRHAASVRARRAPAANTYGIRLDHLERMTDERGIIQFARGGEPDNDSGYCVDDVARLGIIAAHLARPGWTASCLRFLDAATSGSGMYNLMDRRGRWLDDPHLGDHVGRAIWAAGVIVSESAVPQSLRLRALEVLRNAAPLLEGIGSPRSLAYGLLGLTLWPASEFDLPVCVGASQLGTGSGPWFEQILTYDNARLPQALLASGARLGNGDMVNRGLSTLEFYLGQVGMAGDDPVLRLVGNEWRDPGDPPTAREGDEQPIDAAATVEALVEAWRQTGRRRYADLALRAFAWFHGANRAGIAVYDEASGGCHDGLSATRVNANRGAESTLAYFQALLSLSRAGLVTVQASPRGVRAHRSGSPTPSPQHCPPRRNRSEVRR